ncbi:Gfo/Idh/MocA family oxidoreductase [Microbacterium sp. EYE_5]|uniref:Gfo/Idh/MocA family protein n=1 Tax=unclassified Microbacterium TaxID=2609290 RepID=UPI002002FB21|nr:MULTISPECIES: Gfo/Idh/MocA family oxidoreductase [unclassified Microbacterium]MCK6079277.1 Gfo/Idh/MocA family oxidoreductase [Microbacterium sp. EYE_382]MCK6084547.1 Gfo/Idh/MocA family oxidoreductase [Microbacterium sp. EYE_384]MCK6123224.1 Gfo/Idh/MocA family oxidoreductase [Microbacterium sp. EYE_80]MCK6125311.1 Gfo/Idh/MocA family oxidoreductase [Microbacterium sp. EYE_79]MCK6140231.1 Gfo/Idh/MocA family oxidoreductase [Microbacterium sp. EYE_39]
MSRTRYALVGAGHRAQMYVDAITTTYAGRAELVAVCEPNPVRAAVYVDLAVSRGADRPAVGGPDDLERLIGDHDVDRVIICSRDDTHAEMIVRALRAGADVVVEKPLTIDAERAAAIEQAVAETGRRVVLTFNYRYAPRNSTLRQVIRDGRIGQVTSIDFSWMLDTQHGADYFRRWHREKEHSGGLLVHKSSHHFDLVNWWIGQRPRRVFASGGLRFYGAENAAARSLGERPARGTHDGERDPFELDLRGDARLEALYLQAESHDGYLRDRDVFGAGISIEDNLALVVDYDGGATLSYSLNAHAPWEGYRVAVNGTEGRAELEVIERGAVLVGDGLHPVVDPSATDAGDASSLRPVGERLILQRHWSEAVEVPIEGGGEAHGGGDVLLLEDVFAGPVDDPLGRPADWTDGVRSIAVGIAGNRSLETGTPIRVADLGVQLLADHG